MKLGIFPLVALLAGCAGHNVMEHYVPAHCNEAKRPFSTFSVQQVDMPGFIQGVIDESVTGALSRVGLRKEEAGDGDILVRLTFELIDRNPPPRVKDPFAEPVETSQINRFVVHVDVDIYDTRTNKRIWTGSMSRAHAIQGGETFHNDRAVLTISRTLNSMFAGLTTPCD